MYLLSSDKTTVLSYYDDLEPRAIYEHKNGESVDFQIYSQQQVFVEVNKKSGIEILRIKEVANNALEIQRVQKLATENVYCVACAKNSMDEMALGLSNGNVKIYNFRTSESVHSFSTENNRNSVCFCDYNSTDEYIAAVYESGHIATFGLKTLTKVDNFKIDGYSTLVRFHPFKRFNLAITSSKGSVTLYDVQAKKKIFHASNSHSAACRDVSMSSTNPEVLISVGYDCLINVFDIRRKTPSVQIYHDHPLSAITLSPCGIYFCVGNLKGELALYDMRNTKSFMHTKKLHENAVTRVAFVPNFVHKVDRQTSEYPIVSEQAEGIMSSTIQTPTTNNRYRDSFCDGLDFKMTGTQDNSKIPRNSLRRDSYDWAAIDTRNLYENPKLDVVDENSAIMLFELSKPAQMRDDTQIAINSSLIHETPEMINISKHVEGNQAELLPVGDQVEVELSAPNTPTANSTADNSSVLEAIEKMRNEMNDRFNELEADLKLNNETNKWQTLSQISNLWNKQNKVNEQLLDALALLLRKDPFVAEFARLTNENEQLKQQLNQKK